MSAWSTKVMKLCAVCRRTCLGSALSVDRPPWVRNGRKAAPSRMSAFGGKADVNHCVGECPLIAISGHSDPASATWRLQPYRPFPPSVSGLTKKVVSFLGAGHGVMRSIFLSHPYSDTCSHDLRCRAHRWPDPYRCTLCAQCLHYLSRFVPLLDFPAGNRNNLPIAAFPTSSRVPATRIYSPSRQRGRRSA